VLARGDRWPTLGFLGFPQWESHPSPSPSSCPLVPRAGFATLSHNLGTNNALGTSSYTEKNFSQCGGIQATLAKKNWCGETSGLDTDLPSLGFVCDPDRA